jgi:hypothetical protein
MKIAVLLNLLSPPVVADLDPSFDSDALVSAVENYPVDQKCLEGKESIRTVFSVQRVRSRWFQTPLHAFRT